jgi:hypothetical protein
VVVVGVGVWCAAAIASARVGAKTMLIGRLGILGGMMNVTGPQDAFSHLWNAWRVIIAGLVKRRITGWKKGMPATPSPRTAIS